MNIEDILADQFAHEADRRPEPELVLDAVHQRIARQGRTTNIRALSALGAAAAVAAIVITATVVAAPSGPHSQPAGEAAPAITVSPTPPTPTLAPTTAPTSPTPTPTPTLAPTTAPTPPTPTTAPTPPTPTLALTTAPTSPKAVPAPSTPGSAAPTARPTTPGVTRPAGTGRYLTIDAGWLPGPAKQNPAGTSSQPGFQERDWDVTVDGAAMDVIIWTETGPLPTQMQATGGTSDYRQVTVNGHPGREFIADNVTIIAFDLGNGTTAYVGPSVRQLTAAVTTTRITAIAVKVAANMQFDRHDPIPSS